MNVEIWYPGVPGSEAGKDPHIYDLRRYLPPNEAAKVSDAQNPWQPCPCYDGLPLDTRRGPPCDRVYPRNGGLRNPTLTHGVLGEQVLW